MSPPYRDKGWRPETPPLQGRGLGWGLSNAQLQELHRRAAEMRRNPTEPEKWLWRHLSNGQLDGHKFRRQSVIGWFLSLLPFRGGVGGGGCRLRKERQMTFGRSGKLPTNAEAALWFISKRDGITEAGLARAMFGKADQPRIHQEVDVLESAGLVRRDRSVPPLRLYTDIKK